MARWISTKVWGCVETSKAMDLVLENAQGEFSKELIKQDLQWLYRSILASPSIKHVGVLTTTPEDALKMIPRYTFRAYVVVRESRSWRGQKVKMLYLIPRKTKSVKA